MNRFIAVLMLFPALCLGQAPGAHRLGQVLVKGNNIAANVGPYANIKVCVLNTSCNSLATIYTGPSMTVQLSQPVIADGNGNYSYFIPVGCVDEMISTPGQGQIFVPNVCPFNGQAGGGGGGSSPAGNLYELNAKLSTSQFQGSNFYANSDKTLLSTAVPTYNRFVRNPVQSGYCGGRSCANNTWFNQDAALLNGAGINTGWGQQFASNAKGLFTGLGIFDGYGPYNGSTTDPFGGGVIHMRHSDAIFHTPSITQFHGVNLFCSKPYDCGGWYMYHRNHGGNWDGGGEGITPFRVNGGNSYQYQTGFAVIGNPGAGATTINSTLFSGDDLFVGGFVYNNNSSPIITGNVTNYDPVNHILTVTTATGTGTVTPPTTNGTSTTAISPGPTEGNANGFTAAMTVHINSGAAYTIATTNPVLAVCPNDRAEIVVPTAVSAIDGSGNLTLTAVWEHGHPAGCEVDQGGTWGVWDFMGDRIGNNWKTSYFAYGATDSTHLKEATYLTGSRGFINPSRHNFGGGQSHVTNAQVSRTSNVTKICGLGQSDYNFGGQYIRVSGATPSDFNGTFLSSLLDANYCVTYANTGSNGNATGAVVDTGGDVNPPTGFGLGGFAIWQTARVKQLGTVTTASNGVVTNGYSGTVYLSPNSMTMTNGNNILVLDDMQNKIETISSIGVQDTPPHAGIINWADISVSGKGVMGNNFHFLNITNGEPWTSYAGGGSNGTMSGPTLLSLSGASATTIDAQAPVPRGKSIWIHNNPMWLTGLGNNTFFPLFVDGALGGGGGLAMQYNPGTGTTVMYSGKGNGPVTAITMTPTDISFGGTGTFTFQGSSYTFTGLSGTGINGCAAINGSTGDMTKTSSACGTVTSVGITPPAWASVSGSPVTTSGNITLNLPAFIGSGATHNAGVVPDPGATPGNTRFLREDGQWQAPVTTGFTGKCTAPQTPNFTNGIATGCS